MSGQTVQAQRSSLITANNVFHRNVTKVFHFRTITVNILDWYSNYT